MSWKGGSVVGCLVYNFGLRFLSGYMVCKDVYIGCVQLALFLLLVLAVFCYRS